MTGRFAKVNFNDYKPLREVIFNTLRQAIITGELKPGERLMEVQLANSMGVSRTPVREAIRKLELEGLVDMLPRKGASVANLSAKNIMDVLEVRASLDGLATELASERITDEELKELSHIQSQFMSFVEKNNLQGLIKKDVEFHEAIYRASRNDKLIQIVSNLREQVLRFRIIYIKDLDSNADIVREHAEIIKALTDRNSKLSFVTARNHIRNQEEAIIAAVKKHEIN
jgi:DNA-binding GntR family transcriptional regulator